MTSAHHPVRPLRPTALQLRRKKDPAPLSLPADYVPTDYTSLPPEEPPKQNPMARVAIGVVVLLVVVAAVVGAVFLNEDPTANPPAAPAPTLTINPPSMNLVNGELRTRIEAATNAEDGTSVSAELLEDGNPFGFWDPATTTQQVENGKVLFELLEAEEHEPGRAESEYVVQLTMDSSPEPVIITSTLDIRSRAMAAFTADNGTSGAQVTPTALMTETVTTAPEVPPTAVPEPTVPPAPAGGPLNGVIISRPGFAYVSPYGPAGPRGNIATGQQSNIVVKLPVGDQTWYLTVVPASGVAGWVNSSQIDLPAADVNRITGVSNEGNLAVVFNGGNLRAAPGGGVVGQVEAGQSVTLTGRLGDNSWFEVTAPAGSGWVASALLTIKPETINSIPVK